MPAGTRNKINGMMDAEIGRADPCDVLEMGNFNIYKQVAVLKT